MGKILTNKEVENYHKNGFFFPVRVMSPKNANFYRRKLEEYEGSQGPLSGNDRHKHIFYLPG